MMTSFRVAAMSATVAAASLMDARAALACGGCFHPPPEVAGDPTVVSEHHMVFSVSQTQTVLTDQIKYSGNPKEFAWVLPVHPGTTVELSHDEFIKALDAYTSPMVIPPAPPPPPKGSALQFSCGCASSASSLAAPYGGDGADSGVSVVSDIVVGPYEVVTLHTTSGDSLNTWLAGHKFEIGPTIQPIIDAYVKEGFDFIAMRLLPGQGVQSMQPVRVITPGADATLPLRMVAAGVGAKVGVVLYVIGEGRYHTQNFHDEVVDDSQLTWDATQSSSNYATLADQAMTGGDSRGVLTEFAGHAYTRDPAVSDPNGSTPYTSLSQAYYSAVLYAQSAGSKCTYSTQILADAGDDSGADDGGLDSSVADDGGVEGGADDAGGGDGGVTTPCVFDDITVATTGMVHGDVWVTRLRMDLPVGALGDDLRLAAADQTLVSNYHQVPTPGSGTDSGSCATSGSDDSTPPWFVFAFGALGLTLVVRRRRR